MEKEDDFVGECVPLGLLLAGSLRDAVAHADCVALPHCEREGVKLAEAQEEPVKLSVTEEEVVGVLEGECVPLVLPLAEPLREAVPHALCVALPHCDREGVPLADTQADPL